MAKYFYVRRDIEQFPCFWQFSNSDRLPKTAINMDVSTDNNRG